MRPRADGTLGSSVFASVAEFAAFIKGGVTSYGPPLHPGRLTKVDLFKEAALYEPLDAPIAFSELEDETWSDAGLVFDSAIRAKGAKYIWVYRGLWSKGTPKRLPLGVHPLAPPPGRPLPPRAGLWLVY